MNRIKIVEILIAIDEEIGVAFRADDNNRLRAAKAAHEAVGRLHVDGVDVERMRKFNNSVGALGYVSVRGITGANHHPDRCKCQEIDPTPHKHYDTAPHNCARCMKCESYDPAIGVLHGNKEQSR